MLNSGTTLSKRTIKVVGYLVELAMPMKYVSRGLAAQGYLVDILIPHHPIRYHTVVT